MATRSTIALEFADGTVGQIYCHWDGYLSNNGEILLKHYSDPFKVRDLLDQGDLSSLRPEIGIPHPFSYIGEMPAEEYDRLYGDMCTFYGRDRGEEGTGAKFFGSFEDYAENHQYEEYEYILRRDGQWYVDQYGKGYTLLKDEVERERAVEETLDA